MSDWKNRITGYGEESPDQLLANPHNHRIHPKRQQDALSGSLDTLGYIQTVIVNKATGHIVDGHLRVTMALREGQSTIPVTYVDLTPEEEAQALLSLDPIAAMAATDAGKVDELLRLVNTDNEQVMKHLADFAAENKLEWGQPEPVDAEPQIDRAAELQVKWQTETGQLWQLGNHRLLIDDCTVRENVERLMGGDRAGRVITDPPFINNSEIMHEQIIDIPKAFENARVYCDGKMLWFGDNITEPLFPEKVVARHVWHKTNGWQANHWEAINVFTGKNERLESIVYSFPNVGVVKRGEVGNHLTPKPPKLIEQLIEKDNDILDLFCGSGTTIIAAQNLSRRCYAMEISPNYSAVILERFQTATGITPELVN